MIARLAILALAATVAGCAVDVGSFRLAAPRPLSADAVRTATSRGWHDGLDCRFWVFAVPLGLPQIDRAMNDAMRPVHGSFMREMTIFSVHPVYGVFGRHCYRVHGEVFAVAADGQAAPAGAQ
jgi:hypothetical protein